MGKSDENTPTSNVCDLPSKPIETLGEVFEDGCFLEVVHNPADRGAVELLLYDGESAQVAPRLEHEDQTFVAAAIEPGIGRELHLPAAFRPNESASQLAVDIMHLGQKYCGLVEEGAELLARFFFADWLMDALPAAPSLVILGPESREVTQLLALTKCLARHALLLTEATANNLRCLPTALGLTLVIDQPELKKDLKHLLNASRKPAMKILHHGSLWSPCFSKVVRCADQFQASSIKGPKILVAPNSHPVPLLNDTEQARIAGEFQPRMLSFRFDNFAAVRARTSDDSSSESAVRAPLSVLPGASFEDAELHGKILDLTVDRGADTIEDRWTDPTVVLIECLLMSCHILKQSARYMGQLADEMMTLLSARGEERKILPKQVGRMIRDLGFETEPRDKHGVKILFTEAVRTKIHKLAHDFAVPSIEAPVLGCPQCEPLGKKRESTASRRDADQNL